MTTPLLTSLVNNTLRAYPQDGDALDDVRTASRIMRPADVKPSGVGGWNGDPDFLVELVRRSPKRLPQLIGPRTISADLVDTLLAVEHRPTAAIAERVAAHRTVTRTGIEYILRNGTKKSIRRLLEDHFPQLTAQDLQDASRRVAETSGELLDVLPELQGDWIVLHYNPAPTWRSLLEAQVRELSGFDSDLREELLPQRDTYLMLLAAHHAGLELPTDLLERLPKEYHEIDLTTHRRARYGSKGRLAAALSLVRVNPKFGDMLRQLSVKQQATVVQAYPRWEVLAQCSDSAAVAKESGLRLEGADAGELTPEVAECLPLSTFTHDDSGVASRVALGAIRERLGDDAEAWADFVGVADSWEGTLGELLDTVTSI